MIEISEKQARIIHTLLINKERTWGRYYGLSSAGLKRMGLNRRTFDNNRDYLLSHHLIRLTSKESHGLQNWYHFDATLIGFLTLFQNMLQEKIPWMEIKPNSFRIKLQCALN